MSATSADEIGHALRTLHGTMTAHYQLEEREGHLSPVARCGPDEEVKRRTLFDDHRARLHALEELVRAADVGEGLTPERRDRVTHWIQDARRHEECEAEFIDESRDDPPC